MPSSHIKGNVFCFNSAAMLPQFCNRLYTVSILVKECEKNGKISNRFHLIF